MENKRKYHIIVGSKTYFDAKLPSFLKDDEINTFLELIKLSDIEKQNCRINTHYTSILIVKNDNYLGIVESAHNCLGPLIEDLTTNEAEIYIHNSPRILKAYLENQHKRELIELEISCDEYEIKKDSELFVDNINIISAQILGRQIAIEEISKKLWYLTNVKRKKPYVIMLYGNSILGKTELRREFAKMFFNGKYLEKHLPMFKDSNYSEYFFVDVPNRRSFGFDLLERESNLIFFDGLDKCPEYFFSVFYTLFDNKQLKDAIYDVDISGIVIVLTSNYQTEDEMKKPLKLPIFYRIDKFIQFDDFSCETIC